MPTDYSDIGAELAQAAPLGDLDLVRGLALEMLAAQRVVDERKDALDKATAALKDIQEKRLPQIMKDKGLPSFTFADHGGEKLVVELDEDYQVSVPTGQKGGVDKRPAAFAFFRSINLGGLIKKQLVANLGLRGDNVVGEIVATFKDQNPDVDTSIEEKIEPQTLKAEVKKLIKAGKAVPTEVFTIFPVNKAVVKTKKS